MASEIEIRLALIQKFPALAGTQFKLTSEETSFYNCIAWAASDNQKVWWPGLGHWPAKCPKNDSLKAFIKAFRTVGYNPCDDSLLEGGRTKIAFYGDSDGVLHAARQLDDGFWTSKLGPFVDISHELGALEGDEYGYLLGYMSRAK